MTYVCEFDMTQCCDQHVVWLEIPVHHTEAGDRNVLEHIFF